MKAIASMSLIISFSLSLMGCGASKAKESIMTEQEKKGLSAALANLESVLDEKSPFISKKLSGAASEKDIVALRKELGGIEIQCLENWYCWHNGCTDKLTDIIPLGRMLSISESLEDRAMTQKIPFVDSKRKNAIKILDDGAGDGFFMDISIPRPRIFYHMLEDPFPRDYGTLEDFVVFIKEVHASGIAAVQTNGMVNFDLDKYHIIESKYLDSLK